MYLQNSRLMLFCLDHEYSWNNEYVTAIVEEGHGMLKELHNVMVNSNTRIDVDTIYDILEDHESTYKNG